MNASDQADEHPALRKLDRLIIEWRAENGDLFLSHNEQLMFRNEILALFADKLAGLLEKKITLFDEHGDYNQDWVEAIPVSAVEKLLKELKS